MFSSPVKGRLELQQRSGDSTGFQFLEAICGKEVRLSKHAIYIRSPASKTVPRKELCFGKELDETKPLIKEHSTTFMYSAHF